jgi:trehalose/maltose transport system substrate-binding protein
MELSPIVGREQELAELTAILDRPECRLVTIFGMGGIGKTRLALALAHSLRATFAHSVLVSLAAVTRPDEIVPALGRAIGISAGREAVQAVLAAEDPDLLVVLDNFEHLLPEGTAVLEQLLTHTSRLCCIVTSRAVLATSWEWRYYLGPLDYPAAGDAEEVAAGALASSGAVQLFQQVARRVRPRRALETDELHQAARICRLVGGMPLGIELAAAQVGSLSCAAIADQLVAGIERLTADLHDLPMRHHSLQASFDASWSRLTGEEQAVLARLAVVHGECSLPAALEIGGAQPVEITHLVDKSLLQVSGAGLYSLHEVIRQHAAHKLALAPDAAAAALLAYRAYYLAWAENNLYRFNVAGERTPAALALLENHLQHVWHLWLNCEGAQERDRVAVALTKLELVRRTFIVMRSGTINTWSGVQQFVAQYTRAAHSYSGVLAVDTVWLPYMTDHLADLTDEFSAEEVAAWIPELAAACHVGARLLACPMDVELGVLYYRRDLLHKYGFAAPPRTWDELEQAAATIQAGERAGGRHDFWGFIWPGRKPEGLTCTALEWQHAEGGGCILGCDGRPNVANRHAAAALSRAARWVGAISPPEFGGITEVETVLALQHGQAAFARLWSSYSWVRKYGPLHDVLETSVLPCGRVRRAATLGGWPLAVNRSQQQQRSALDLVGAMTSPAIQRRIALQGNGRLPAHLALFTDPALQKAEPILSDLHQLMVGGGLAVRPAQWAGLQYGAVSTLYSETVTHILQREGDAEAALAKLGRELAALPCMPSTLA